MGKQFFTGTTEIIERNYETEHRKISRKAAVEGFVLLKNDNQVLPIPKGSNIL